MEQWLLTLPSGEIEVLTTEQLVNLYGSSWFAQVYLLKGNVRKLREDEIVD